MILLRPSHKSTVYSFAHSGFTEFESQHTSFLSLLPFLSAQVGFILNLLSVQISEDKILDTSFSALRCDSPSSQ